MKKSYQCCDVPSHANASKCRIQKKSKVNKRLNTQHTIPSLLLPRNFLYFCEFSSRRDFFAMLCSGYSIDLNYTVTYNIELKLITVQAVFCITCILPIFLYGSEIWCLTSTLEKKIDALDNGVSDASSISIGRTLSPMMWFGHIRDNHSCQILSVNGACPSLVICAVPTPVKTTH